VSAADKWMSCTLGTCRADDSSRRTLLFPLVVPPTSNGWSWPKRALPDDHIDAVGLHAPELAAGLVSPSGGSGGEASGGAGGNRAENGERGQSGKYVMGDDGSLTDDEEGGGGYWE
jgi:palmitoyltransferase